MDEQVIQRVIQSVLRSRLHPAVFDDPERCVEQSKRGTATVNWGEENEKEIWSDFHHLTFSDLDSRYWAQFHTSETDAGPTARRVKAFLALRFGVVHPHHQIRYPVSPPGFDVTDRLPDIAQWTSIINVWKEDYQDLQTGVLVHQVGEDVYYEEVDDRDHRLILNPFLDALLEDLDVTEVKASLSAFLSTHRAASVPTDILVMIAEFAYAAQVPFGPLQPAPDVGERVIKRFKIE